MVLLPMPRVVQVKNRCRARFCRVDLAHAATETVCKKIPLSLTTRMALLRLATDAELDSHRAVDAKRSAIHCSWALPTNERLT